MNQVRILTVCSGNICRSPLAELLIQKGLSDEPEFTVASAGSMARDGDVMPEPARELASRFDLDPTRHRARYLTEQIVSESDVIFAMSRSHRSQIVKISPAKVARTFTLREFARLSSSLTDAELSGAATGETIDERVASVIRLVFAQKATVGPAADPLLDDVIDPYKRDASIYDQSGREIVPAAAQVVRVLRLAAAGVGR